MMDAFWVQCLEVRHCTSCAWHYKLPKLKDKGLVFEKTSQYLSMYSISKGSHSPGKLVEICQPGELLELFQRPGIFGMMSRFLLVLIL